ncbi:hypothetical protein D3C83_187790 [compost metagenome]
MGGVDAGASAIGLLGVARVRCAVRAQKELRIAAHCRFDQRLAMRLALEYRQAVVMGAHAAGK